MPVVVIALVLIAIEPVVPPPLFVTVRLVNAVPDPPPTMPPKVVVPAVEMVRFLAPLMVEAKLISPELPAPVLLKVVSAPKVTASL